MSNNKELNEKAQHYFDQLIHNQLDVEEQLIMLEAISTLIDDHMCNLRSELENDADEYFDEDDEEDDEEDDDEDEEEAPLSEEELTAATEELLHDEEC